MNKMDRREFIGVLGAGTLAATASLEAVAQLAQPALPKDQKGTKPPDLMSLSRKAASTNEDFAESYFWLNDHTILFLHLVPKQKGKFRAVLVDTTTGKKTIPQEFNAKNSSLMQGNLVEFETVDSHHWDYDFAPPDASLSPDGKWLLWQSNVADSPPRWIAATFDGKQEIWKKAEAPHSETKWGSNEAFWTPDSKGWIELVSKYAKKQYTLPYAHIYRLGQTAPVKSIRVEGLQYGLKVGMTREGEIMMFYPPRANNPFTEAAFSLVSLNKETVKAESLMIPIPKTRTVWSVVLSPQGDRLAWIMDDFPGGKYSSTIYLSDSKGRNMDVLTTGVDLPTPRVHWLPDGLHISVIYNKSVRVLSA